MSGPGPNDIEHTLSAALPRTAHSADDLSELLELCRRGRLFDVQAWIAAGRPLQLREPAPQRKSALRIAVEAGNHSLVQVLLAAGYDSNLERESPLTWALADRRGDLVELLLEHGCDPRRVGLYNLFMTYDRELIARFYALGVDLTAGHELAGFLAHQTSNRVLYGFVKHHRVQSAAIARELQIALHTCIDEKSERAIALCLWAGAEVRSAAPTLSMASVGDDDDGEEDRFDGWTAVEHAARTGNLPLLKRFRPNPELDDFESLHRWSMDPDVLEHLFSIQLPAKPTAWLASQLHWFSVLPDRSWSLLRLLERAFASGLRCIEGSESEITQVRRSLLKGDSHFFRGVIRLLCQGDYCSSDLLQAIARTPSFRRRLQEEGYVPGEEGSHHTLVPPTGRREVQSRLGFKQPKAPPPSVICIGHVAGAEREAISRQALFNIVWGTPMRVLAKQWGLSDRGLAKACGRAQVPVPPRGYWARVEAGQNVKQPKLPAFKGPYEPRVEVPRSKEQRP